MLHSWSHAINYVGRLANCSRISLQLFKEIKKGLVPHLLKGRIIFQSILCYAVHSTSCSVRGVYPPHRHDGTLIISSALSIPLATSFVYLHNREKLPYKVDWHRHSTPDTVTHDEGAFLTTAVPTEGSSNRQVFNE